MNYETLTAACLMAGHFPPYSTSNLKVDHLTVVICTVQEKCSLSSSGVVGICTPGFSVYHFDCFKEYGFQIGRGLTKCWYVVIVQS